MCCCTTPGRRDSGPAASTAAPHLRTFGRLGRRPGQRLRLHVSSAADLRARHLINNEIGWKTQWFDRRLEFNGAVYQEDWKDVQVQIFESCCYGNLSFVINGPNYRVRGVETETVARPTPRPHGHRLGVLEQQQLDQRALFAAAQRPAHHHSRVARPE